MKAYMVYSRYAGPQEGACLVFAHTSREAKKVGYRESGFLSDSVDGNFTGVAAKHMKGDGFLFMEADIEKLRRDIPHCIEDPESCVTCELWGVSELDKNKECESCARERVLEAE